MTVQNQDPRASHGSPQRISSRPDGMSGRSSSAPLGRELTAMGILTAFRRRWIPALAVAIPVALLVTAAVWELIPATYQSAAILKIEQNERKLAFSDGPQRETDFLTYRESQKNYMLSRQVITAALRNPKVAECPTLKKVAHPSEWLMGKLRADDRISAEFLKVTLEGEHPRDLALILNAVKDAYLEQAVYMSRNGKIEELRRLEEQFDEVNRKVVAAEDRIDKLAESLGTGDPKTAVIHQNLIQDTLDDLSKTLREVNSRIRAEEAARASLSQQGFLPSQLNADGLMGMSNSGFLATEPSTPVSPGQSLQRELMQLRIKISQFEEQLRNPDHPDLLKMKRQEQQLTQLLGGPTTAPGTAPVSRMDFLIRQRDQLMADIEQQKERLAEFNTRIIELGAEKRKIETDIQIRDELLKQKSQRQVELYAPDRITVVQDANIPEEPEIKKKTQLSLLAGMATLGCIVFGFTLFEWLSHRIGAATDVSGEVGMRLIGTIPSPDRGGLLGLGIFAGKVDYDEWNRVVTESMDVVRTFLMRHIDPSRSASILITSASANEGKTTVSCQLAASLARTGKRVALVDCDFRRPTAHLLVDGKQSPGLSEFMRGETTLEEIRQPTQAPGLTFIGAGEVDQRVLQLLSVDGGRNLIQQLKSRYDFVIIDTSPLLFVAEPSMIAQNSDIVLLSTRKDYSRVQYAIQARDSLRSLQVPLLGCIMVGADSDFQRQTYGYQQEVVRMTRAESP